MDIKTLLQSLLGHKVKFLVIGAWALPAYGYSRATQDIDIFFSPTQANARKVRAALYAVGYTVIELLTVQQILSKKILLRQYVLQTDLHPFVAGVNFETAWKSRREVEIKGLKVFVPSLDNLIAMKKAAGRLKDLGDLEVLKEIQKQISKK